ncbi:sepiapterin reductase [Cynoglossus semilaevis]|uniref:Sepiapterin reductase n=1 Tax=Cynoglossus semilaevis TaxID=244447 RepID=A0A3P8WW18_CYNSE|nr:sepiapterin reductase [Cynoglossus semilaevis]
MSSTTALTDLGQALCIVTGASRGLGRTVAKHLARLIKPGSAIVLTARSGQDLRSLQTELTGGDGAGAGLVVECVEADLGHNDAPGRIVSAARRCFKADMDHVILVNNAGSVGDVSHFFRNFTNMAEVNSYLSFNVSSCLCLTAGVLDAFPQRDGLRRTVVNISSICALQPYPSWSLYCTGKAARNMMFKVLAKEEPDIRVLNYGPGPLDTDMLAYAKSHTADENLRMSFNDMCDKGQVLSCDQSCSVLMKLLLGDSYESGAHVDVYDV